VAFDNSLFWRTVNFYHKDIAHPAIVKPRVSGTWEDFRVLLGIIRPHLWRCTRLEVYADPTDWIDIAAAFHGEGFSQLKVLIAHCYEEEYDDEDDGEADLEFSAISTPPLHAAQPQPLSPPTTSVPLQPPSIPTKTIFALPPGHQLREAQLYGMSLGDVAPPRLDHLHVMHVLPDIVAQSGQLQRWFLDAPEQLQLDHICVPPRVRLHHTELPVSYLRSLVLRGLRATPRDEETGGDTEHDCRPFFGSLMAARELRALEIDGLDLTGRVWSDFLEALSTHPHIYPRVTSVILSCMHFHNINFQQSGIVLFLGSFPALERLELRNCWDTGDLMLEILNFDSKLCPRLKGLDGDGGFLHRSPMKIYI
ncbi:hypothetical protein B0H13DRAFT_2543612, partial [Mycena leptocephala]